MLQRCNNGWRRRKSTRQNSDTTLVQAALVQVWRHQFA
jgi:hypothetical protein